MLYEWTTHAFMLFIYKTRHMQWYATNYTILLTQAKFDSCKVGHIMLYKLDTSWKFENSYVLSNLKRLVLSMLEDGIYVELILHQKIRFQSDPKGRVIENQLPWSSCSQLTFWGERRLSYIMRSVSCKQQTCNIATWSPTLYHIPNTDNGLIRIEKGSYKNIYYIG